MIKSILLYLKENKSYLFLLITIPVILHSCANMATPTGGDYDFDPPKILKTTPGLNAKNVNTHKIEIVFDELIKIENASEKVIVTPPQRKSPIIQAISNKIKIELRDTLLLNTTYTIDFTDAIVDNNEGNPFENFAFSFSTGEVIDTMAISGKVLSANNLEPVKGIYVGLHSDLNDSAFINKTFEKISRTNDKGEFTIRGVAEGKYRIYALDDINRSYKYEDLSNAIAFNDSIIVPGFVQDFKTDTVFKKDLTVDSIRTTEYTRFLPDNIVLRSFVSSFKRQYLQKHERQIEDQLKIYFGSPTDLPKIEALNFDETNRPWALLERSAKNDSLHYWIIDQQVAAIDTLSFRLTYNITDSLNNIVSKVDTLNFIDRTKKKEIEKPKKKKNEKEEIRFLSIENNIKGSMNVYDTINIIFEQPISDFDEKKFKLQRLIDSTYVDETFVLVKNEYNPRRYSFAHKWKPGSIYKFVADSAAFHSYSGLWTNKLDTKFSVKKIDEYGDLYIGISGLDKDVPAFVELLDPSDKPLRKSRVEYNDNELGVLFMHLIPGKYYARIVIDTNGNGIWDTGDYYKKIEPEMVYYYNKPFDIKANWQIEETWNVDELALDKQKPLDITKNKPKERESRRKQLEKEDKAKADNEKARKEEDRRQNDAYGTARKSY